MYTLLHSVVRMKHPWLILPVEPEYPVDPMCSGDGAGINDPGEGTWRLGLGEPCDPKIVLGDGVPIIYKVIQVSQKYWYDSLRRLKNINDMQ